MSEKIICNPRHHRRLPRPATTAERRTMARVAKLLTDEFAWTLPGGAFRCVRRGDWIYLRIGSRDCDFNLRGQLGGAGTSFVSRGLVLSHRAAHKARVSKESKRDKT